MWWGLQGVSASLQAATGGTDVTDLNARHYLWAIGVAVAISLALSALALRTANLAKSQNPTVIASIDALLKDREAQIEALHDPAFVEPNQGILGSYLAKIRRDGVPRNAGMKRHLDALAANTVSLLTLVDLYESQAATPQFKSEAKAYRTYAIAWTDRWNSVMEIFMAGGNYPAAEVPFPEGFGSAVADEVRAAH